MSQKETKEEFVKTINYAPSRDSDGGGDYVNSTLPTVIDPMNADKLNSRWNANNEMLENIQYNIRNIRKNLNYSKKLSFIQDPTLYNIPDLDQRPFFIDYQSGYDVAINGWGAAIISEDSKDIRLPLCSFIDFHEKGNSKFSIKSGSSDINEIQNDYETGGTKSWYRIGHSGAEVTKVPIIVNNTSMSSEWTCMVFQFYDYGNAENTAGKYQFIEFSSTVNGEYVRFKIDGTQTNYTIDYSLWNGASLVTVNDLDTSIPRSVGLHRIKFDCINTNTYLELDGGLVLNTTNLIQTIDEVEFGSNNDTGSADYWDIYELLLFNRKFFTLTSGSMVYLDPADNWECKLFSGLPKLSNKFNLYFCYIGDGDTGLDEKRNLMDLRDFYNVPDTFIHCSRLRSEFGLEVSNGYIRLGDDTEIDGEVTIDGFQNHLSVNGTDARIRLGISNQVQSVVLTGSNGLWNSRASVDFEITYNTTGYRIIKIYTVDGLNWWEDNQQNYDIVKIMNSIILDESITITSDYVKIKNGKITISNTIPARFVLQGEHITLDNIHYDLTTVTSGDELAAAAVEIDIDNGCRNFNIHNCKFIGDAIGAGSGIYVSSTTPVITRGNIDSCYFKTIGNGITIQNIHVLNISNNKFNDVTNPSAQGKAIHIIGTAIQRVNIMFNDISTNYEGITCDASVHVDYCKFIGNYFHKEGTQNQQWALHLDRGSYCNIANNITRGFSTAMYLEACTECSITNNNIENPTTGILLDANCTHNNVNSNNVIGASSNLAIDCNNADNTINVNSCPNGITFGGASNVGNVVT